MAATHRIGADAVARRLRAALPLISDAELSEEVDGWAVVVRLDPLLVDARAGQQGLLDRSVAAAVVDPRVRRAIADAIARVNAACAPHERIVHHEIAA